MLEPRCGGVWKSDPIVKFSTAFNKDGYNHSVALRESGNVDFYYNCCRCHFEDEVAEIRFSDVECGFDEIYLTDTEGKVKVLHPSQLQHRLHLDQTYDVPDDQTI
jgi:hypothetical protein